MRQGRKGDSGPNLGALQHFKIERKKRKLRSNSMWGGSKERKQFQGPKAGVKVGAGMYLKKEKVANSLIFQGGQVK